MRQKKMMKYRILLLFLTGSVALSAKDKSTFAVKGERTKNEVVAHGAHLENSKITVVNISEKPIFLVWETVSNTFPKEWDCSMCQHGKCQIGIPNGSVFKRLDAGQEGFITIHVLPKEQPGSGRVQFKIYDKEHPEYFEVLTFFVKVL
jgi:hypothetical protein